MDDAELALKVLDTFEAQAQPASEQLIQSIEAHNAQDVGRRAHAFRGTAGTIAATRLVEAIVQIETLARESQWSQTQSAAANLQQELKACLDQLPKTRKQLQTSPNQASN